MKNFYIVSVGTSLIANFHRNIEEGKIKYFPKIKTKKLNKQLEKDTQEHNKAKNDCEDYKKSWKLLCKYIETAVTSDFKDICSLSAELSSILLWNKGTSLGSDDKILFLATSTLDGMLCAHALKKIIIDKWKTVGFNDVPCEIEIKHNIDGLADAKEATFATKGLPNFLDYLVKRIRDEKKEDFEVILIPTGGYKALIPYMVIAGILEGVPCRYVYEESENVLELPPLPLHVDLPKWLQIETVIDVLKEKPDFENNKIWQIFSTDLPGILVPEEENGTTKLKSTGIDQILSARSREIGGEPELVVRAKNSPLLKFIEDKDLKQRFLKLASIGPLIWKGDRVPEMVDHGLRHHNDLFLLAEKVLLPIFYYMPDFLNQHELFALLCALFLHDCGHVIGWIDLDNGKKRRLLPTEVRDHHHVLGYLRLNEPEKHGGFGAPIHDALKKDDNETSDQLWKDYLHAVAVLGLYHRKKMKIESGDKYYFFEKDFPSLEEYVQKNPVSIQVTDNGSQERKQIEFNRMALLVCLLRIIDGLDEQASRTGSPADVAFHLAQLDTEVKEEKERGDALTQALVEMNKDLEQPLIEIDKAIRSHMGSYTQAEGKGLAANNGEAGQEKIDSSQFRSKIEQIISEKKLGQLKPLIDEYVLSRLRAQFKEFQKSPYGEKVYIRGIKIEGKQNSNNEVEITIDLQMLEDKTLIREYEKAGCPIKIEKDGREFDLKDAAARQEYREYMLDQLKKEYTAENSLVEKILKKNKIIFIYKTKGVTK